MSVVFREVPVALLWMRGLNTGNVISVCQLSHSGKRALDDTRRKGFAIEL